MEPSAISVYRRTYRQSVPRVYGGVAANRIFGQSSYLPLVQIGQRPQAFPGSSATRSPIACEVTFDPSRTIVPCRQTGVSSGRKMLKGRKN